MYDFRGLEVDQTANQKQRPIEALNYNGHWLDDEVAGFTTLTVSGRHEFTRQVNSQDRASDGSIYLSSRLESRKIEVVFRLWSTSIAEYNKRLGKLKQLLFEPNRPFYFADDQDMKFTGSVTELSLDDPTLTTKGTITLTVTDPYKYGYQKTLDGTGTSLTINDDRLTYDQTPQQIEFTPASSASALTITCGNKTIKLTVGVPGGQKVVVNFTDLALTINNVANLMALTLDSNFSDFYIQNGSTITFNTTGTYRVIYEVKQL